MKRPLPVAIVTTLALAIAAAAWLAQPAATAMESGHNSGEALAAAPAFTLSDPDGNQHALSDYAGQYVVLEWHNEGCPFVKKFYNAGKMQQLQQTYTDKDVAWLTICSSAEGKQGYMTADQWNSYIDEHNMHSTAVLLDTSGDVGRAYGATNTPHMYIINPDGKIIYQGAIDDTPTADPADIEGANNYVAQVLNAALIGKTKAYGCSVKY